MDEWLVGNGGFSNAIMKTAGIAIVFALNLLRYEKKGLTDFF